MLGTPLNDDLTVLGLGINYVRETLQILRPVVVAGSHACLGLVGNILAAFLRLGF